MEPSTDNLEQLNETGQREKSDRRKEDIPVAQDRRKVQRRRLIDPTTCERDYTTDEIEFMQAMDDYKRRSGRMFPTCSEILEVIRGMGYVRLESPQDEMETEAESSTRESSNIRTAEMISGDLDHMDDVEDSYDLDEIDHDFDDE